MAAAGLPWFRAATPSAKALGTASGWLAARTVPSSRPVKERTIEKQIRIFLMTLLWGGPAHHILMPRRDGGADGLGFRWAHAPGSRPPPQIPRGCKTGRYPGRRLWRVPVRQPPPAVPG